MVKGGATVLSPSLRVLGESVRYTEKVHRKGTQSRKSAASIPVHDEEEEQQ